MTPPIRVTITDWEDGQRIPERFAFGKLGDPMEMSDNVSPGLQWSGLPSGTKSVAVIMSDPDVPSVGDDVNVEGREIPADLPRITFTHWVLIDLPASTTSIAEGAASNGVTPAGKAVGPFLGGLTGSNDYTSWFSSDPKMGGIYGGYDGPCPPWNDSIIHHYNVDVFALDVVSLDLEADSLTGPVALAAMKGHVMAKGSFGGTYSLNQRLS